MSQAYTVLVMSSFYFGSTPEYFVESVVVNATSAKEAARLALETHPESSVQAVYCGNLVDSLTDDEKRSVPRPKRKHDPINHSARYSAIMEVPDPQIEAEYRTAIKDCAHNFSRRVDEALVDMLNTQFRRNHTILTGLSVQPCSCIGNIESR